MRQDQRLPCPNCGRDNTLQPVRKAIDRLENEARRTPMSAHEFDELVKRCKPQFGGRVEIRNDLVVRKRGATHMRGLDEGVCEEHTRFYWETCGTCGMFYNPYADQVLAEFKRSRRRFQIALGHVIDALGDIAEDDV